MIFFLTEFTQCCKKQIFMTEGAVLRSQYHTTDCIRSNTQIHSHMHYFPFLISAVKSLITLL